MEKKQIINRVIGELLGNPKYKFLPNGLLGEICRDFVEVYDRVEKEKD